MKHEAVAIVAGLRGPFSKAGSNLAGVQADDLASGVFRELLVQTKVAPEDVDELVLGNVGQPSHAANIARVVALKAGLPVSCIANTVHRNCASGMESITTAAERIRSGRCKVILAGGTESMSNYPLLFGKQMTALFTELMKARSMGQKFAAMSKFRPSFLKPKISVVEGLTDPVCGLNMGQTAEVLAREFHIDREAQDRFALESHMRAAAAQKRGFFDLEILPFPLPPRYSSFLSEDNSIRPEQSMEALANLRPYFDRATGTVTAANACPLTDGAAAVLLMSKSEAEKRDVEVLGWLKEWGYAGLEGERMGLGPVYAVSKLQKMMKFKMEDMDLVELNEAFAVQVLANQSAFASDDFAKKYLGRRKALGELPSEKLNINGGAIAIGHPVGATGTRLVITLLRALREKKLNRGLATLCIGGGQGAALLLEVDHV